MRSILYVSLAIFQVIFSGSAIGATGPTHATKKKFEKTIWISKNDESLQCEPESGVSLKKDEGVLKSLGIRTVESRKVGSGIVQIALCGSPAGVLNSYRIPQAAWSKHQTKLSSIGFKTEE